MRRSSSALSEEDHRRDDGARARNRVVDDADVGRVLHHHDDAVAGLHAELDEARARARASVEQLGGAEPARRRTRARS